MLKEVLDALRSTGIGQIAETDHAGTHSWVRYAYPDDGGSLRPIVWCQFCGTHQIEVANWKDNPPCPAMTNVRMALLLSK
jgi:hypothetical protein